VKRGLVHEAAVLCEQLLVGQRRCARKGQRCGDLGVDDRAGAGRALDRRRPPGLDLGFDVAGPAGAVEAVAAGGRQLPGPRRRRRERIEADRAAVIGFRRSSERSTRLAKDSRAIQTPLGTFQSWLSI
jgi:hypothetical protein